MMLEEIVVFWCVGICMNVEIYVFLNDIYYFVPLNRILLNVVGRSSIAAIASLVVHCTVVF